MYIISNLKRIVLKISKLKWIRLLNLFRVSIFNSEKTLELLNESNNSIKININRLKEYDNNIYYIIELFAYGGFFAQFNDVLQYLYFSDFHSFKPIIVYRDSFYYSNEYSLDVGTHNTYEYYFNQPFITEIEFNKVKLYKKYTYSNLYHKDFFKQNIIKRETTNIKDLKIDEINSLSNIFIKYIKLNQSVEQSINFDISKMKNLTENYIGVHFRGSDYRKELHLHPKFISPDEYFFQIDLLIKKYKVSKIFLATDDQIALEQFISRYGINLYFYKDNHRSIDTSNPFYKNKSRKFHSYKNGYEVLRDVITLSKAKLLVCGESNISFTAKIINKAKETPYKDTYTFNPEKSIKKNFLQNDKDFNIFNKNRDKVK